MKRKITDEAMDFVVKALSVEASHKLARLKREMTEAEASWKRSKNRVFLEKEGTVADRHALAEVDNVVFGEYCDYMNKLEAYEKAKETRAGARDYLEIWRTEQADARAAENVR